MSKVHPNIVFRNKALNYKNVGGPFTSLDLAQVYNFPDADGTGQIIGIAAFSGRYLLSDITTYLNNLGIPGPFNIFNHYLNGATNISTDTLNDKEITLDMQVLIPLCPRATFNIYMTPNNGQGDTNLYDIIEAAINDGCQIISVSFGFAEVDVPLSSAESINSYLKIAADNNINVFVASGDNGSNGPNSKPGNNVLFPSSSPYAICVCGTTLYAPDNEREAEVVWNDNQYTEATGGGISRFFPKPDYQSHITDYGGYRLCADVAGLASVNPGYIIYFQGQYDITGGTSATAPLYAGLFARISQLIAPGVLPFINPILYQHPEIFYNITEGNNGFYQAQEGYDVCTGLGVIDGTAALNVFSQI